MSVREGGHKEPFIRLCHHKDKICLCSAVAVLLHLTAHCSTPSELLLSLLPKWLNGLMSQHYSSNLAFLRRHLASNEHGNGSPLPSKRTQICIPGCFKHLLRPHLAQRVFSRTTMCDSPAWGQLAADRCRLKCRWVEKEKGREKDWRWTQRPGEKDRRGSPSKSLAGTAKATCFNLRPLRASECVYRPNDCFLACFLPPRISVRASLSALLLWFSRRDREGHRVRQRVEARKSGEKRSVLSSRNWKDTSSLKLHTSSGANTGMIWLITSSLQTFECL